MKKAENILSSHPCAQRIRKLMVQAMSQYSMIAPGDRIMVCVSGGKDSTILALMLKEIQCRSPHKFSFSAVILDQKQPGFDAGEFATFMARNEIDLQIIHRDTYSIVTDKIKNGVYCSLCSRLRRAILYDHAAANGFSKLALGHHREDINETLLLNLFYTGKLATMPPKLKSDDGRNILIRPLAFVTEKDLSELRDLLEIPIIPCNLCGSQDGLKRRKMKKLLASLEQEIPNLGNSMLSAAGNLHLSHLLDRKAFEFSSLEAREPSARPLEF